MLLKMVASILHPVFKYCLEEWHSPPVRHFLVAMLA